MSEILMNISDKYVHKWILVKAIAIYMYVREY